MKSGIYKIENKVNGDTYIGSSIDVRKRINRHFTDLRNGQHHNVRLQRAFNKYGESGFLYDVIIYVKKSDILVFEQKYIDLLNPVYNICKTAGNCIGVKHSTETNFANKKRNSGFGNGNAKLTPDDINSILDMRKQKTVSEIAAFFGVHITTIERAIKKYSNQSFDRVFSANGRKALSKSAHGNNRTSISVAKMSDTGAILEIYPSMVSAGLSVNRNGSAVSSSIKRNGKCGGYKFKIIDQEQS